ncbi:MAG: OmpA family protein [Alphaproteobacteria bacterium]|nr:OmpA family protein [Alphaproteobacteria bacterium]
MTTRSLLLGAVASLVFVSAASAGPNGWYLGLEGGGNWVDDTDVANDTIDPTFGGGFAPTTSSFETGWAALGTVGYGWNRWRAELELGYRDNELDVFTVTGTPNTGGGEFNEASAMLNFLYDWDFSERFGLFVGAGAGADYIQYKNDSGFHTVPIHDSDVVFAWQAMAGLNYRLTGRTDLVLAYRYFNASEPEFTEIDGGLDLHNDSYDNVVKHTATIGLRYHFGQPAMEPMVAAPPPPPPPMEPAAPPREFIVFFGHNKSNLTAEAQEVIRQAAAAAKQFGSATLTVIGHADRSGSPKYNQGLSQRRAGTVKGALVAEGIPGGSISTSAKGESDPMVPTADGVREPQNRRVHINL